MGSFCTSDAKLEASNRFSDKKIIPPIRNINTAFQIHKKHNNRFTSCYQRSLKNIQQISPMLSSFEIRYIFAQVSLIGNGYIDAFDGTIINCNNLEDVD